MTHCDVCEASHPDADCTVSRPLPDAGGGRRVDLGERYRCLQPLPPAGPVTRYLAERTTSGERVLVSSLPDPDGAEPRAARFLQRAWFLVALSGRHGVLASVHECGRTDDGVFMAVEHPDGTSLADLVARERPLDLGRVLRFGIQVGEALEALHNAALAHGALSAKVVTVIGGADQVKVGGYGMTLPQEPGRPGDPTPAVGAAGAGWPGEAGDAGEQTDIRALAALLYHMLAGAAPVGEPGRRLTRLRGVRRDIPAGVDRLILRALDRGEGGGFPDVTSFLNELWTENGRLTRRPPTWRGLAARRVPAAGAAAVLLLAAVLASLAVLAAVHRVSAVSRPQLVALPPRPALAIGVTPVIDVAPAIGVTPPSTADLTPPPAPAPAPPPQPAPARELGVRGSAAPARPAGGEDELPDPGAIIDWLLRDRRAGSE